MGITKITYVSGVPLAREDVVALVEHFAKGSLAVINNSHCAKAVGKQSAVLKTHDLATVVDAHYGYKPNLTDADKRSCDSVYTALLSALEADIAKWGLTFKCAYHDITDSNAAVVAVIGMTLHECRLVDDGGVRRNGSVLGSLFNISATDNRDIFRLKLTHMLPTTSVDNKSLSLRLLSAPVNIFQMADGCNCCW